ncbi:alpha/beta-hydrolase [Rhizodiscina lignyota]|uniref:Alpha/beta-hydrolase n=1 Tax=Rhizodiscina lignyota TaxID=1504668 RepID=A0A9P4M8E3_9PEZI|nr:alpha/beta-hydrolase [Rhizodiscina lignyota]
MSKLSGGAQNVLAREHKPSIVIVHGSFHVPEHFDSLITVLSNAGYTVTVPLLPSISAKPAVTSLDPDIQAVRDAIEAELKDGKDVIVFAHSYGGVPSSSALKGLSKTVRESQGSKGGVIKIIYCASHLIDEGATLAELNPDALEAAKTVAVDGFMAPPEGFREQFYNLQTESIANHALSLLRLWSIGMVFTKATYAPWRHDEIPATYIFCEKDRAVPPPFQELLTKDRNFEIVRTDSDHSPFLDRPEWVAKVIRRAAGEDVMDL